MKAYKVFNHDFTCRNFKYEVGKTYEHSGRIGLCESGFHACEKIADCFNYYSFDPENKICEVELSGEVINGSDKSVCSKITIVKELSWSEMLSVANVGTGNSGIRNSGDRNSGDMNSGNMNSGNMNSGNMNSGDRNSGYRNSGDRNSGNMNSGDRNSGNMNSGDMNSGDMNSGYRNSGVFCTRKRTDMIPFFNKESKMTWDEWYNHKAYRLSFNLTMTEWIWWDNMTDEEREDNKSAYICDGYLKTYSYHEAWANLWNNFTDKEKECFTTLPNFDKDVFEEITGIKL